MAVATPEQLKSIPQHGDQYLELAVPGALPLPLDSATYIRWDERPLAIVPGIILASWAHHHMHFALTVSAVEGMPHNSQECFLIHRSNQTYSFWSIPPVEDYAITTLQAGFMAIFCAKNMNMFLPGETACYKITPLINNSDLAWSLTTCNLQTSQEVQCIPGQRSFLEWKNEQTEQITMRPALITITDTTPEPVNKLIWLQTIRSLDSQQGSEYAYSFEDGWHIMRSDPASPIHKQFEALLQMP